LTVPSFSPLVTATDLPYAQAATVRSSADQILRPAHLLATGALFLVILYETGRIPVETHTGTNEFGMIEEARAFEYSGLYFALLKWGSACKQLILYIILIDVFTAPGACHPPPRPASVGLAVLALLGKAVLLGCVVAVIDDSFAKLRCSRSPSSWRRPSCSRCWPCSPSTWEAADAVPGRGEHRTGHLRGRHEHGGRAVVADRVRGVVGPVT
jgi:formate hydrogenlyase subunit 4